MSAIGCEDFNTGVRYLANTTTYFELFTFFYVYVFENEFFVFWFSTTSNESQHVFTRVNKTTIELQMNNIHQSSVDLL